MLGAKVKQVLMEFASQSKEPAAVLLSGGMDSTAIVFSLLEAGRKVTAYTFMLDHKLSSDFARAQRTAKLFGIDFVPVFLPLDLEVLWLDMIALRKLGATKKTDYECFWPFLYSYPLIKEQEVFSGLGADGHFCISKKGMLHYRHKVEEFRDGLFTNPRYAQQPLHKAFAKQLNKVAVLPFLSAGMREALRGTTWDEVNKPKQKQPILDAFPQEFAKIVVKPHLNLQLGDSGIQEHIAKLLGTRHNTRGSKAITGILNDLNKQHPVR